MRPSERFLCFAFVGAIAGVVDMAVVEAVIRITGADPYSARVVSYLAAATTAWALNRRLTFTDSETDGALAQWARYLGSNMAGAALNYLVYALLVSGAGRWHAPPFAAVAAGSLAGLLINFAAASRFVFRRARTDAIRVDRGGMQ